MAKTDQQQVKQRISDVLRLLASGASHLDLKRYAESKQWNVSPRQLQRYSRAAYREMVRTTQGKRSQRKAQHLLQRDMLFTRACKEGDGSLSLDILKDKAKLENLYPEKEPKSRKKAQSHPSWQSRRSSLSTLDRLVSYLKAEEAGDEVQMQLVQDSSPYFSRVFVDFTLMKLILGQVLRNYLANQLARFAEWATVSAMPLDPRSRLNKDRMLRAHQAGLSYAYKVCHLAWARVLRRLKLNRNYLTRGFPGRSTLATYHRMFFAAAPTLEDLSRLRERVGWTNTGIATVPRLARRLNRELQRSLAMWSVPPEKGAKVPKPPSPQTKTKANTRTKTNTQPVESARRRPRAK